MNRQISFAFAGIVFGFLMGYVVAHEVYGGRFGGVPAAGAAAAPMPAMSGPRGDTAAMADPNHVHDPHEQGGAQSMESVTRELEALKARIAKDPQDAEALRRLGSLYMDAGMYDQSIGFLRQAVAAQPGDPHGYIDLGTALLMQGGSEEALGVLRKAVEAGPDHARSWYVLGFALIQTGSYQEGEKAFARSLELSPGAFDMEQIKAEIEKRKADTTAKAPDAGS